MELNNEVRSWHRAPMMMDLQRSAREVLDAQKRVRAAYVTGPIAVAAAEKELSNALKMNAGIADHID